jgi:hypothetical protein
VKELLQAIQKQDTAEIGRILMMTNSSKELGQKVFDLFKAVSRMTATSVLSWAVNKSPQELEQARERLRRGEDIE